jgi:hypothetical protein
MLLAFVLYPLLFPPTREQIVVVPARVLWEGAGVLAAGAVAARAGGTPAVLLYISFELLTALAGLPGRNYSCSRTLGSGFPNSACDPWSFLTERWTSVVPLAIGLFASRLLVARDGTTNTTLRGAGTLALVIAIFQGVGMVIFVLFVFTRAPSTTSGSGPSIVFGLSGFPIYGLALGELVGGSLAGVILARRRFAAPLLVSVLLIAPSFATGIPLWRGPGLRSSACSRSSSLGRSLAAGTAC